MDYTTIIYNYSISSMFKVKKIFLQLIKDLSRCSKYKETSDTHIKTTVNIKRGLNYDNFKSLQSNSFIYKLLGVVLAYI